MIDRALLFLRDQLNEHLARGGGGAAAGLEDVVSFVDGDKLDPLTLKNGAISLLLVNLEQDTVMRRDDPFVRLLPDGTTARAAPEVRLNLWVLFVARFRVYEAGLAALSSVLAYFQARPLFDQRSAPALDPGIERLAIELKTLPLNEQNDLWSALRIAYHPSLLFRVRMVAVQASETPAGPPVSEPRRELAHADPSAP
ncbi:MAG TPA: DUF4255 domain-containing protein [Xanthobacteraceae bacterium]|nr:DUF4255 domain-containing protein [Xanthobacteraceae bacterium]